MITGLKNSKITAVPTAFPLVALSFIQPPKYSASKGNSVCTSLNFLYVLELSIIF